MPSFLGSPTWLFCLFPFALPCFAPTAVPQVPAFCFLLSAFLLTFHFLSSASFLGFLLLGFLFLPFLLFSVPPHSCFPDARFHSRFFRSPLSLQPDFSCLPLRFLYLASCLFPFILPSFAPTAASLVLPFFPFSFVHFSFRIFRFPLLSFVRFVPLSTTQPSASPFPFFPILPGSGFLGAFFPLLSGLFPCLPLDSGTQSSAFPFSVRPLVSQ